MNKFKPGAIVLYRNNVTNYYDIVLSDDAGILMLIDTRDNSYFDVDVSSDWCEVNTILNED